MQVVLRRRAAHNGLELSCPAARATAHPFSRNLASEARSNFPHASRVSCSELLGGASRCVSRADYAASVLGISMTNERKNTKTSSAEIHMKMLLRS